LTQVTFHDWGSHVVHLVGYGGDCPLWTAWKERDRHWTLLSTTLPSGGCNPAKTPRSTTWSDSSAWQCLTTHCRHDKSGHSGTRLGLEILPHPPYPLDLALLDYHLFCSLSINQCGAEFPSMTTLAPKLARRLLHG
jgi:hypothetical protein